MTAKSPLRIGTAGGNPGMVICGCGDFNNFELRIVSTGTILLVCSSCDYEYELSEVVDKLGYYEFPEID